MWLSGTGDIERGTVMFAGHEDPTRWELRVTDLFRRQNETWERFHIDEDACVAPRGLDDVPSQLP